MPNKQSGTASESETTVTPGVSFTEAGKHIKLACMALEDLQQVYARSTMDPIRKAGLIAALDGKIDYLKGLPLNPNAYPWVDDD